MERRGPRASIPAITPAQIHGALTYYYGNKAAMEAEIDRISREAATARAESLDSPFASDSGPWGNSGDIRT